MNEEFQIIPNNTDCLLVSAEVILSKLRLSCRPVVAWALSRDEFGKAFDYPRPLVHGDSVNAGDQEYTLEDDGAVFKRACAVWHPASRILTADLEDWKETEVCETLVDALIYVATFFNADQYSQILGMGKHWIEDNEFLERMSSSMPSGD